VQIKKLKRRKRGREREKDDDDDDSRVDESVTREETVK